MPATPSGASSGEAPWAPLCYQELAERYVFPFCDYFLLLDAGHDRYVTYSHRGAGCPLPPRQSDHAMRDLTSYLRHYAVPADADRVCRESAFPRVVKVLHTQDEHTIVFGVNDPHRGYTRKQLRFTWCRPQESTLFVSCIDVTAAYQSERDQHEQLTAALTKAETDSMTGILNHQATIQRISQLLEGGLCQSGALFFIDLDFFKQVNDGYGHLVGDQVLCAVAAGIRGLIRPDDLVGRIGGDEFVLFLPHLNNLDAIRQCANRILSLFDHPLQGVSPQVRLSCSIGISMYPRDGLDYRTLARKADHALYFAKRQGKHRFMFAESASPAPTSPR